MKIDIILPYKEIFSATSASAVSLTVKNSYEFSKFKKNIFIYGQHTDHPFYKKNFIGVKINKILNFGKNLSLVKKYIKISNILHKNDTLIELHNRPYLFNYLVKILPKKPIILYYHNDPNEMKGSRSVQERQQILKNAAGVICVSEYIKKQFLIGIKNKTSKVYVLPNGIKRNLSTKPKKSKKVMFVGRLVEEKGAHIFVSAIKNLITKYPKWNFIIIGTSKAGQKKLITEYEKNVIKSFQSYGKQTKYLGFIANTKVKKIMQSSSILVVPSIWDDPFPLTALEGLSSGQAVIASDRGGLKEMLKNTGVLISNINDKKLEFALNKLMADKKKLLNTQNKAWKNFKYDQKNISKKQDLMRKQIYNNFLIQKS